MDASAASPTYLWQVPGKPVSVSLSLDVIERLGMAVKGGFKSLPRRGLETGGLLLGNAHRTDAGILVEIDDFEPVECEHAFGPSYLLSPGDREVFESRIAWHRSGSGRSIVGFYRSHTRQEFELSVEDADLMKQWFAEEFQVFLLLQSRGELAPTAGFAVWEDGKIGSSPPCGIFEFSVAGVTASGLVSAGAPTPPVESAAATAPGQIPRGARQPPSPPRRTGIRRHWRLRVPAHVDWGWLAAAAVVTLTLMAAAVFRNDQDRTIPPVPLGLDVQHDGVALRLVWNRDASVVRSARHAKLWIGDGEHQETLELDPSQLNAGSIMYFPRTRDVNFRMDVFSPATHASETLRAVGAPAPAPELLAEVPKERPSPFAEAPRPVRRPAAPVERPSRPTPARREPVVEQREIPKPKPAAPVVAAVPRSEELKTPPGPSPAGSTVRSEPPAQPVRPAARPTPAPDLSVSVDAEPVRNPPKTGLLARLHLASRHAERPGFVPPAPVHRPALVVPPDLRARARMEGPIEVRVYVDSSGRVEYAELENEATGTDRDLAALAVFSSRRWQFTPAHIGDRKVAGEVLLRYRFGRP